MSKMGKALQRRTVYAATTVAILAMVAGFAVASLTSTVSSSNQNGFGVSAPSNTIYGATGATQSTALVYTSTSTCTPTLGSVAAASGAKTANVFITGTVSCQTSSADWFEEVSFTSAGLPSTSASDVFSITVGANSPVSVTVSYSGLVAGDTVTTNIYYEVGSSSSAVTSDIGITGT